MELDWGSACKLQLAMEIVSLVVFNRFTVETVLGGESESSILMNLNVASLTFCSFFCELIEKRRILEIRST